MYAKVQATSAAARAARTLGLRLQTLDNWVRAAAAGKTIEQVAVPVTDEVMALFPSACLNAWKFFATARTAFHTQ